MRFGLATLIGRFTVAEAVEVGVVLITTGFVAVFVVIALVLPDVAVAATTPGPLEIATILGLKPATA
jgi:hypothetical protein